MGTGACPGGPAGSGGAVVMELDIGLDHVDVFWQLCDRVHGPGVKQFPPKESACLHGGACSRRGVVWVGADPASHTSHSGFLADLVKIFVVCRKKTV